MTWKKHLPTLLAMALVLCAALFLLLSSQAEGEPEVSFETISPDEVPEIVNVALTPPDPHTPPDQTPDLSGAVAGNVAIVWSPTDNAPR